MKVVVVESPAKAKTINKYLGPDYTVLASFGHVRDLKEKDGAVEPDRDFAMHWEIGERAKRPLNEIAKALKNAKSLYLATDPDREGEAISWHLTQVLKESKKLKDIDVKRVVFNEITRGAVLDAMRNPRDLDRDLVEAYMARRALDYLVGFNLSPVLWRKLPGSRSAGRVQSVALRLVCERENEIERFKPREYWTIEAEFRTPSGQSFTARLTHLNGERLDKFALATKEDAERAVQQILAGDPYTVIGVEKKRTRRNPFPPFTTSTLQQEASRKLGFGASRTMRIAQQLYEGVDIGGETVGLITYMRTDSVTLSQEAIGAARRLIGEQYGQDYLPPAPREWKTKAKNAQEAHEAIRPTDLFRRPEQVERYLDADQRRLYELIWRRTIASEMESAEIDQTAVDIASGDRKTVFRATGSVIVFDGFLTLYREDRDDPVDEDEENRTLPAMAEGERMARGVPKPEQHFTQPPPRYTEASLVKKLEELGIGRPSTYASILDVLQDRGYVRLEKKRFIPEDRGRIVTAFLESFFNRYVQYDFTAQLEELLDDISGGRANWKDVLRKFWQQFSEAVGNTKDLTITQVIDALDQELGPHFFPARADGRDPRLCPGCSEGRLSLKLGKFGAFIGCSRYPDCRYTRPLAVENGEANGGFEGTKTLGVDPASGEVVSLRKGPYGLYLQLGEGGEDTKPKRVSLPKDVPPDTVDLDLALKLLALPREVGMHPEDGKPILAGLGRFGPYLKHGNEYRSLESTHDLLTVGLNRAVDILAQPKTGRRRAAPSNLRELGVHPDDGKPVQAGVGRYGPFVKHGSVYANLPKDRTVEEVTLEEALSLIADRIAKGGGKKKRGKKAAETTPAADGDAAPKAKRKAKGKTKSKQPEPAHAEDEVD
ncbi:MAG TPA: type I DNA topoisomerase [Alphaproteobacteria bacterium]